MSRRPVKATVPVLFGADKRPIVRGPNKPVVQEEGFDPIRTTLPSSQRLINGLPGINILGVTPPIPDLPYQPSLDDYLRQEEGELDERYAVRRAYTQKLANLNPMYPPMELVIAGKIRMNQVYLGCTYPIEVSKVVANLQLAPSAASVEPTVFTE